MRRTWQDDDWPAETEVAFALAADGDRTELRLTHGGCTRLGAPGPALRAAHVAGWRKHLADLRDYVEETVK